VISGRYLVVSSLFTTCLITANILAVKLTDWHGHVFAAGIVVFPVSYILGDVLTEVWGFRAARRVIWTAFFCNLVVVAAVEAAIRLPNAGFGVSNRAYEDVLGYTPRLLGASFAAYLVGEFANSAIMARMKIATDGRWLWSRTIGSTLVGEALDSAVFTTIAFAGTAPLLNTTTTNWVIKVGYEVIATPLTYAVITYLKRAEGVDVYDRDTPLLPIEI
jgi:uncharacterized integral membrane protein (TIGR00697 family)